MKRKTFLIGSLAAVCSLALPGLASSPGGDWVDPQVKLAMALLRQKTAALGVPSLQGADTVAGQVVPVLRFGTTTINNKPQTLRRKARQRSAKLARGRRG